MIYFLPNIFCLRSLITCITFIHTAKDNIIFSKENNFKSRTRTYVQVHQFAVIPKRLIFVCAPHTRGLNRKLGLLHTGRMFLRRETLAQWPELSTSSVSRWPHPVLSAIRYPPTRVRYRTLMVLKYLSPTYR